MYYFIINPASGSGKGRIVWNTIKKELEHLGIAYRHFLLRSAGEGTALAAALSSSGTPCTIVVVGGDGTIDEVINGLTDFEHITFACIPTGSGNDFVRGLGLKRDPLDALHTILHPAEIIPLDVGITTYHKVKNTLDEAESKEDIQLSHRFAVSSGFGYDAAVCYEIERSKLKVLLNRFHSGKLVYLVTALRQLLTMQRLHFDVKINDQQTMSCKGAYFAAAMNLSYEGGGFYFCPDSIPNDGEIDVLIVDGISRLRALCLLPLSLIGKHVGHHGIHMIRCKKLEIYSPEALCVHSNGEVLGFADQITFSVHEKKLAVIVR